MSHQETPAARAIDRVVWIHLEKRLDRKLHMEAQLASSRFLMSLPDVRCHLATPPHRLLVPASFRHHGGHWSCRRAHLDVLEAAWVDGCEGLLVLEDDIVLGERFDRAVRDLLPRLPEGWWGCYLGGTHRRAPMPWNGPLRLLRGATRTHAYLLSRRGITACFDRIVREPGGAIDQEYNRFHQELMAQGEQRFFCAHPWIVHTRDDYSDNNGQVERGTKFWADRARAERAKRGPGAA